MDLLTVGNMYPPHHLGGYEAVWRSSVDALRAAGHDVTVLTTDTRLREDAPLDPPHVHRTLRWYWRDHAFPPPSRSDALDLERHDHAVMSSHLKRRPDVVLFWSMGGMPLGLLGDPLAAGVGAAAVVHDGWPVYGPNVDGWERHVARRPRTLRVAGRALGIATAPAWEAISEWSFNSAWLRDAVLRRRPEILRGRASVLPPGIDAARFRDVPPPAGGWRWRLACVGRIDARKGLGVAIDALDRLPGEATLTIAGDGDPAHLRELQARADARVTFLGAVDDVAGVYEDADAVLFPVTWDEPFGLVPLEAMASGRPVVATGTGGSAEFLRDGENALVVEPDDPAALAGALTRLATDPALRAHLVEGGRATAHEHTLAAFTEGIESLAARAAR